MGTGWSQQEVQMQARAARTRHSGTVAWPWMWTALDMGGLVGWLIHYTGWAQMWMRDERRPGGWRRMTCEQRASKGQKRKRSRPLVVAMAEQGLAPEEQDDSRGGTGIAGWGPETALPSSHPVPGRLNGSHSSECLLDRSQEETEGGGHLGPWTP